MGRSYWFECGKCGYRAKVSGRAESGVYFASETISCRDCKQLYDAVTRVKVPDLNEEETKAAPAGVLGSKFLKQLHIGKVPPTFQSVSNRLPFRGVKRFRWLAFRPQCPSSPLHRVESWADPGKCPRCGVFLERSGLPYHLWD